MPLHHDIINALVPIIDNQEAQHQIAVREYVNLLALCKAIKAGEVSISDVVFSDDGWQIMPPEPEDDNDGSGTD